MNGDIVFEEMNLSNVLEMRSFGRNKNPLLSSYDFWPSTKFECEFWFQKKTESDKNKYFVARYKGKVFLYLSIKNIDKKAKSALLGIVADPNYTDRGLGTRALSIFLDYYFNEAGFEELKLTVDFYNDRAKRVYEKLGFKVSRKGYQVIDFSPSLINRENQKFFLKKKGIYFSKIYFMRLDKKDYLHS